MILLPTDFPVGMTILEGQTAQKHKNHTKKLDLNPKQIQTVVSNLSSILPAAVRKNS